MKKLLLTFLVGIMGVITAGAAEDLYLQSNITNWENVDSWKISGTWDGSQDVYEITIPASSIGSSDFEFKFFRTNENNVLGAYTGNDDYSFQFSNGQNETYDANGSNNFVGSTKKYVIEHSKIKASAYKISIYVKYPENSDWLYYIKVEIVSMPLKVTDIGYATFSCDRALDFTNAGVTAYVASAPANGRVSMNPVSGAVPANTGLFIAGSANTYDIPVVTTDAASNFSMTNYLHPTTGNEIAAGNYVFAKQGDDLGFYPLGSATTIEKGKAYLSSDAASGTRLSISFTDDATAISSVKSVNVENGCFDLQGRRIAQPTKGLYIVNGKKVIK